MSNLTESFFFFSFCVRVCVAAVSNLVDRLGSRLQNGEGCNEPFFFFFRLCTTNRWREANNRSELFPVCFDREEQVGRRRSKKIGCAVTQSRWAGGHQPHRHTQRGDCLLLALLTQVTAAIFTINCIYTAVFKVLIALYSQPLKLYTLTLVVAELHV